MNHLVQNVDQVVKETGPPHMRMFITRCSVGNTVCDGEGNGKKVKKNHRQEKSSFILDGGSEHVAQVWLTENCLFDTLVNSYEMFFFFLFLRVRKQISFF